MRSRAEWALRAAALGALLLLIWGAVRSRANPPVVLATAQSGIERALVEATRRPVSALNLELDGAPGPMQRDWLAAIRGAGTDIAYAARGMVPVAIAASTVAEPEGRVRVTVAGGDSATVVVSDALGAIDTVRVGAAPYSRLLRTATGSLIADGAGSRACTPLPEPVQVRRLLVIGLAGWESKFAIAALEEAGWTVDARIRVAPGVETVQGARLPLDTARYTAVIALDGAAVPSADAIERYVASGGGAILAGTVTRSAAFARLTPAVASSRRMAEARGGLVLGGVKTDAVVLEGEGSAALVAARRSGSGRVAASGHDETWKWRMRRAEEAPADHREWWTALVSAVAYVPPAVMRDFADAADPAPVAALIAALGPLSELERAAAGRGSMMPPDWLLLGVLLVSLMGEVLSRRLRGLA